MSCMSHQNSATSSFRLKDCNRIKQATKAQSQGTWLMVRYIRISMHIAVVSAGARSQWGHHGSSHNLRSRSKWMGRSSLGHTLTTFNHHLFEDIVFGLLEITRKFSAHHATSIQWLPPGKNITSAPAALECALQKALVEESLPRGTCHIEWVQQRHSLFSGRQVLDPIDLNHIRICSSGGMPTQLPAHFLLSNPITYNFNKGPTGHVQQVPGVRVRLIAMSLLIQPPAIASQ